MFCLTKMSGDLLGFSFKFNKEIIQPQKNMKWQRKYLVDHNLLAHLSFRLTSQHEVIATEGLTYVLQQSSECRRAVELLAGSIGCLISEITSYQSEVAGENLERPDIVGRTSDGHEAIIIEGKFDAGLTDNQPNNYLLRLSESEAGLLIFVVPELRVEGLWKVVTSRASDSFSLSAQEDLPDGSKCISVGPNSKLMMVSWGNLLNTLLQPAQRSGSMITSDILQLISLCNRIEGETFKPFNSEELTSVQLGRRHRDLCNLVDAITDRLLEARIVSAKGMKATPQRDGYVRYFRLGDDTSKFGAYVKLDYSLWVENEVSPIWFGPQNSSIDHLRETFKNTGMVDGLSVIDKGTTLNLPLEIKLGQEFSEIVDCAIDRITKFRKLVNETNPNLWGC